MLRFRLPSNGRGPGVEVVLISVVGVLLVLVAVVTLTGRRGRRAASKQKQAEAGVTAENAEAQHDRSLARQADVRAAHAERASKAGSDTDD
jgi:Na+-transporting methylmalonyl-CoA/oxaloacetate decarboxylase gamma subunit